MNDGLKKQRNGADRIFTIPNMLSFFRICLIPVIVGLPVSHDDRASGSDAGKRDFYGSNRIDDY